MADADKCAACGEIIPEGRKMRIDKRCTKASDIKAS